jgi:hypothetical protein
MSIMLNMSNVYVVTSVVKLSRTRRGLPESEAQDEEGRNHIRNLVNGLMFGLVSKVGDKSFNFLHLKGRGIMLHLRKHRLTTVQIFKVADTESHHSANILVRGDFVPIMSATSHAAALCRGRCERSGKPCGSCAQRVHCDARIQRYRI